MRREEEGEGGVTKFFVYRGRHSYTVVYTRKHEDAHIALCIFIFSIPN